MEGSLALAVGAGAFFVVAFLVETRVLLARRLDGYFLVGLPLREAVVPIPRPPRVGTCGKTASVNWEVCAPHLVRFWAEPGSGRAPVGLHGVVVLAPGSHGVQLEIRWSPPWTFVLAAVWFAALGVARGDGLLAVGVAALLVLVVGFLYGERVKTVAAELRWAFVNLHEADE